MIHKDTVRLLRECDSGIKMGIQSIDDCIRHVESQRLKGAMLVCKDEHNKMKKEIVNLLDKFQDKGKDPNALVSSMSKMKTNMKLMMNESDSTVASLMTDGCNMGVKSLSKYLNKYKAADEDAKNITKRLISAEEQLARDVRAFL